jgi:triacylglycerol esterase/lipase EstA (alpha/beta hydrolase family)
MKKFLKLTLFLLLIFFLFSPILIPKASKNQIPQEKYIANFQIVGGSFLEVDGYKTYYIDINPEAEETVLLIHGFGGSATNWTSVMYELADEGFRVVAVDLKGFGLSEKKVDDDFSHKSQAKFLGIIAKMLC